MVVYVPVSVCVYLSVYACVFNYLSLSMYQLLELFLSFFYPGASFPLKPMMHIEFPHISAKCINFLLFSLNVFFPNLCFCFPYFDHDAFMHHALEVIDAPANVFGPFVYFTRHCSTIIMLNYTIRNSAVCHIVQWCCVK